MSAHNRPAADAPLDLSRWRKVPNLLIGAGVLLAVVGLLSNPRQFGYSWLFAYMFYLSFALGALFLVIVHHLFDASWSVPEPELTLLINPLGTIAGYSIGNDMSSRDIEAENPLYLPQAKIYDGSCAIGPCILLSSDPLSKSTAIKIAIARHGKIAFSGNTTLAELKRDPLQLAEFLFRDNSFPHGVFLLTGTGIVPGDDFTLASGDIIRISIDGIGTLENPVA